MTQGEIGYLPFIPVDTDSMANLLKKDAVWDCLRKIKEKGTVGVTAEEISLETGQPLSTVYGALDRLRTAGYVTCKKLTTLPKEKERELRERINELREDRGLKKKIRVGKSPRVYFQPCEKRPVLERRPGEKGENPWGDIIFSYKFDRIVSSKIRKQLNENPELKARVMNLAEELYDWAKSRTELELSGKVCPNCGKNHKKTEFLKAAVLHIATTIISTQEFQDLSLE